MAMFRKPADYWGITPDAAMRLPLGLRHSNNLMNIKYYRGAERDQKKWPGLIGPSIARDQGDPQMLFDNPESSGIAAAGLLRRKYNSGMRSTNDIIAGRSGWTPGYTGAVNNVSRILGVTPNADLRLDTPEGMRAFLPALTEQEHGEAVTKRLMTPDFWDKVTERATGAQFASGDLPKLDLLNLETGANAHRWGGPLQGVPTAPGAPSTPGRVPIPNRPAVPAGEAGRIATNMINAASPSPTPAPGPQPMADPSTPNVMAYAGMLPNDTQRHRKIAQLLMQQATDASPVQHWTQALARVVAGGVGRMHDNAAQQGEREGQSSVAAMMGGNPTPQQLFANPYTQEMGKQLWLAQAKSRIQGPEEFGKSGAIFQGQDGRFYSMQFGSRGERIVKPVEADGKPLSPAKGVKQVGDELIDMATGNPTRNVSGPIANEKTAEEIGRGRGKTIVGAPKLMATQADLERQHSVVNDDIDRAMKEIDWKSVGIVGGLTKAIPGSPAYALAQKIATIKANVGFDKLAEMRANSPTGGALGAVTERELAFLQSVFGSLEQAQDADEIRYNLRRLKDYLKDSSASRRRTLEAELKAAGIGAEGTLEGRVGTREAPPPPAPASGWSARRLD